ncbi:MAG: DUF3857 domain-containing protein [Dysgonamonadaceae bacterium]|jgi:hypothetical protein|nr:DUF3857 domain-containing protein [Dysgonamonadaceae bacterium]
MKKLFLIFTALNILFAASAQDKFKFGDCPAELLQMTVYDKDSTASAVVIYENCRSHYEISPTTSDFQIVTDYVVRMKVLTKDGISFSESSIPFYQGSSRAASEEVKNLTGFTYNLENGKVVKDKLSKDYIFTENVSDNNKRLKFALPSVKEGSVFEYKYTLVSPYYFYPRDFVFQRTIPVIYSVYQIRFPEYFRFNKEVRGYEPIKVVSTPENEHFLIGGNSLSCNAEEITAEVNDLPALKDEEFVWNYNDYKSQITFEISGVNITGVYYKDFSNSWNKVVTRLAENQNFGKQFNDKGLLKNELPEALNGLSNSNDSIRAILNLVRSKIKWNGKSNISVSNISKAMKEGTGSSAEINALLLNALRNSGYNAYPVVMSLRSRGRIPMTHPGDDRLNYFLVVAYVNDTPVYLDGTTGYTDLNVVPPDCLVDRALIIYNSQSFDWVDLTGIGGNVTRVNINARFNEDGILTGNFVETYSGEHAFAFKQDYDKAENEEKYIEKRETSDNVEISDYKTEKRVSTGNFNYLEQYSFTRPEVRLDADIVSFNPLLFEAMRTNPFKPETRKLPIEYPFPQEDRTNVLIEIPEGYAVDEVPSSQKFIYDEAGTIAFSYIIQQSGNKIQISCITSLKKCLFATTDYTALRDFWSKVYNKQNELVTLKKL